ncbi:DAPG hydrolase family protein [Burkholderia cepacia]|uniref:DAPG hydrolase family protein n=2 Tax=Burkholderia cepacia TaxID=292 RepID=UPI00076D8EB8|nr:hypothetical protein [Burkholderia cepacia]AOI81950.1 hypothetical protein WI67_05590 [Burkholderia cepacia]KWF95808.1 hypothetical protein WL95_13570 [Burkholderia cepacia]
MLRKNVIRRPLMLLFPVLLLTGCAGKSPHSSPTSGVPALRPEARQPATPSAKNTPLVLMIHLGRDTPAGLEMINRYWIGTHPSFDRFKKFPGGAPLSRELLKKMGLDKAALENLAYEMALHDMTEFTCLGQFLPDIYREYAG